MRPDFRIFREILLDLCPIARFGIDAEMLAQKLIGRAVRVCLSVFLI